VAAGADRAAARRTRRDEQATWRAVGEGLAAYGPLAEVGDGAHPPARGRDRAAADAAYAAQSREAFKEGARAKLAERAHDDLEGKFRDQQQRRELAELIERTLGKPPSSSA